MITCFLVFEMRRILPLFCCQVFDLNLASGSVQQLIPEQQTRTRTRDEIIWVVTQDTAMVGTCGTLLTLPSLAQAALCVS